MKKLIWLLMFVLILLVIPLSFAAENDDDIIEIGPYKQNSIINIRIACRYSGGDCSPSALCNTTIDYPNTSSLILNQIMEKDNTFFNYTLPSSSTLGKYSMIIRCLDNNRNITKDYIFYITETGEKSSILFIYIIELALKIIFFVFMILISIQGIRKIKKSNENKKTPYLMVTLLRVLWVIVSYSFIFMSPMIALFLFHPNFPIGILQRLTLNTYLIIFILLTIIVILNIFWFGGNLLFKYGGLDHDAKRTNQVLNDMSNFNVSWDIHINKMKNKIFKR